MRYPETRRTDTVEEHFDIAVVDPYRWLEGDVRTQLLLHPQSRPRPHLLRVDTRAGHGTGKPIGQAIDEISDLWAFVAHWTGLIP